jgi:hypothetical protein
MNLADSQRVASELEKLGYHATRDAESADVIVLNTCVVRQSAEDKAYGRLTSLRPLKKQRPDLVINLMGCMVGVKGYERLKQRFPYVDVFSPPSDPGPLVASSQRAKKQRNGFRAGGGARRGVLVPVLFHGQRIAGDILVEVETAPLIRIRTSKAPASDTSHRNHLLESKRMIESSRL